VKTYISYKENLFIFFAMLHTLKGFNQLTSTAKGIFDICFLAMYYNFYLLESATKA